MKGFRGFFFLMVFVCAGPVAAEEFATFVFRDGTEAQVRIQMVTEKVFMVQRKGSSSFSSIASTELTQETVRTYGSARMIEADAASRRVAAAAERLPPGALEAITGAMDRKKQEQAYIEKADRIVMSKYHSYRRIRVAYVHKSGSVLGQLGAFKGSRFVYRPPSLVILNPGGVATAGEEKYWKLYYVGTRKRLFEDRKIPYKVEVYTRTLSDARYWVRKWNKLYDPNHPDDVLQFEGRILDQEGEDTRPSGYGSGVVIGEDGYVLTNAHVVNTAKSVTLLVDDRTVEAEVIGVDTDVDLALLKAPGTFSRAHFARPESVKVGQSVFALGYPMPEVQGSVAKVTRGIVSSLSGFQDDKETMQIDAAIQAGNSGGPVVNEEGLVVGLVVAGLNDFHFLMRGGRMPQNVNYAIRLETIRSFLQKHEIWDTLTSGAVAGMPVEDALAQVRDSTVQIQVFLK